jgi:Protein of unknown function (DUF3572)
MQSFPRKPVGLDRDMAETLAIHALGFIAGEDHRLVGFLEVTGLSPADLRREAGSPGFLAAVLDFIAADESLLLVFAAEQRIDPALVMRARDVLLPGGAGD